MTGRNHLDWLETYCNLYDGRTEAPRIFHFWSGVAAIAGALTRRVVLNEITYSFFPNFYILLVAPPGTIKKTSTMDLSMGLLRDLSENVGHIHFGADATTAEAMYQRLDEFRHEIRTTPGEMQLQSSWDTQCAVTFAIGEFGTFYQSDAKILVNALTDLYDGRAVPFQKDTKKSGTDTIHNPFINIIACTTPDFLRDEFKQQYGGWGLSSRIIFVFADSKERYIYRPSKLFSEADFQAQRDSLLADLNTISNLSGEFKFLPEADALAEQWYHESEASHAEYLKNDAYDPWVGYFKARKQVHMHKLAMVLSVSRRNTLEITLKDVEDSIEQIALVEAGLPRLFAKPLEPTQLARTEQGLLEIMLRMLRSAPMENGHDGQNDKRMLRNEVLNRIMYFVDSFTAERIVNAAITRRLIKQSIGADKNAYLVLNE